MLKEELFVLCLLLVIKFHITQDVNLLRLYVAPINIIHDIELDKIHKFRVPKQKSVDEVIRESIANGKRFKNYNSGRKRLY